MKEFMKGYRKSIWITPEMEEIINTAPIELGFNAKLRHVLCGESPGESPIHEGESPNIIERLNTIQNQIDTLMMWKSDMEEY